MWQILPLLRSTRQCPNDLRDQIHRKVVYRPLQFHKRSQLIIRTHNEALSVATMRVCNPDCSPFAIQSAETQPQLHPALLRLSANDCLQFADAKDREQPLPPTGVVGFRNEARVVKDRSPVTRIDVDCALISFKEMPITPMKTNHDGGEVPCG